MNNLKKVVTISFATICLLTGSVFAETKEINTATRVRKEANTEAKIVTVLYPGNDVEVLSSEGEWTKVKRGDYVGYVKTEFLQKVEVKDDESEIYNTVKNETKNVVKNEVKNETKKETNTVKNEVKNTIKNEVKNTVAENKVDTKVEETVEYLPENKIAILIKTEIRLLPNFFSKEVESLDAGKELEIVSEMNNWYKVRLDTGLEGWVLKAKTTNKVLKTEVVPETENKTETVENKKEPEDKKEEVKDEVKEELTINKTGTVNVETANVREKATTDSNKIGTLDNQDIVLVVSEENGFYKIETATIKGYVSKKLITLNNVTSRGSSDERKEEKVEDKIEETPATKEEVTEVVSATGEEVANYAKQFLGVKYVLGGKSPETGFDCASFTKYVYKNFGVTLGSIASDQNNVGTDVGMDDLKIGDLILFQNEEKTKIGHVGIYIGGGNFVHAANPDRGVVIDNIITSSYYNTRFVTAKRIF